MKEGSQKVERLKNGAFSDMTVIQAVKEIQMTHGDIQLTQTHVIEWLSDAGKITLPNGTTYTLLTLRWV